MQEGTRDIQSAVKFRMGYTLVQREPRSPRDGDPLPNINQYPILNQQEASKTFQATFEKDCGDNDVCESNMVTVANLDLPQGMPAPLIDNQNALHDSLFKNHTSFLLLLLFKCGRVLKLYFFFPSLFSYFQARMAFPSWNWASSRKSSWTFPLPTRESRHTRPVSTSPTRDR